MALKGLDGYIVVDTPHALLVCPASDEQWIKELVGDLKQKGRKASRWCDRRSASTDHVAGNHPGVVFLLGQVARGQGRSLQGGALRVRLAGNFRRLVVPNLGVERRHEHQAVVHEFRDAVVFGFDAVHAVRRKGHTRVAGQTRADSRMLRAIIGLNTFNS